MAFSDFYLYPSDDINLTRSEMNGAIRLSLVPDNDSSWDRKALNVNLDSTGFGDDLFVIDLVGGNEYSLYSMSFHDPISIVVYDSNGIGLIFNAESNDLSSTFEYSNDNISEWIAPYTGTYYIDAMWDPGFYYDNSAFAIYEYSNGFENPSGQGSSSSIEEHILSVIVDSGVLSDNAILLSDINEIIVTDGGVITSHTLEYNGVEYNYNEIDSIVSVVTRDGNFTDEFIGEIHDLAPSASDITYQDAVKLVGVASIDAIILHVAGADGFFVS